MVAKREGVEPSLIQDLRAGCLFQPYIIHVAPLYLLSASVAGLSRLSSYGLKTRTSGRYGSADTSFRLAVLFPAVIGLKPWGPLA